MEEHKIEGFQNRVLSRIFGPKMEEVAGENCIMSSFTKDS
jgi:hypothetical protein